MSIAEQWWENANQAWERHECTFDDGAGNFARIAALAHIAAIREQTEVLRRIADALEEQNKPILSDDIQPDIPLELKYDIAERRTCDTQEAHQLKKRGWILLSFVPYGVSNLTERWTMGRPRNVEGGGEDG